MKDDFKQIESKIVKLASFFLLWSVNSPQVAKKVIDLKQISRDKTLVLLPWFEGSTLAHIE